MDSDQVGSCDTLGKSFQNPNVCPLVLGSVDVDVPAGGSARVWMTVLCELKAAGLSCGFRSKTNTNATRALPVLIPSGIKWPSGSYLTAGCGVSDFQSDPTLTAPYENGLWASSTVSLKIEVKEARGALLGAVRSVVGICGGGTSVPQHVKESLNGGRPF